MQLLHYSEKTLQRALDLLGVKVRRKKPKRTPRTSMRGCLEQAVANGLNPNTVIDVGAAYGTRVLYDTFENARHILIEPLQEFAPYLNDLVAKLDSAEYIIAAAMSRPGEMVINVHPDLVGSSVFKETEGPHVNGIERIVSAVTLDDVCIDRNTTGPYLIKIDTQGSELDVLRGAETVLRDTQFVILEVSLFGFFKGGPQMYDCVMFMKERGFVVYDVFGMQYRPLDGAMSQVDIAFVREHGSFRRFHFYATPKQRHEQNLRLSNCSRRATI